METFPGNFNKIHYRVSHPKHFRIKFINCSLYVCYTCFTRIHGLFEWKTDISICLYYRWPPFKKSHNIYDLLYNYTLSNRGFSKWTKLKEATFTQQCPVKHLRSQDICVKVNHRRHLTHIHADSNIPIALVYLLISSL